MGLRRPILQPQFTVRIFLREKSLLETFLSTTVQIFSDNDNNVPPQHIVSDYILREPRARPFPLNHLFSCFICYRDTIVYAVINSDQNSFIKRNSWIFKFKLIFFDRNWFIPLFLLRLRVRVRGIVERVSFLN